MRFKWGIIFIFGFMEAFADLPSLEFNPELGQEKFLEKLNIKLMNDEILDFLAKNLLMNKADIIIKERDTDIAVEDDKLPALEKLISFKNNLKDTSIMAHEKLELNFKKINDLIQQNPSKIETSPNGEKIIIEFAPKKIIEVSLIKLI